MYIYTLECLRPAHKYEYLRKLTKKLQAQIQIQIQALAPAPAVALAVAQTQAEAETQMPVILKSIYKSWQKCNLQFSKKATNKHSAAAVGQSSKHDVRLQLQIFTHITYTPR